MSKSAFISLKDLMNEQKGKKAKELKLTINELQAYQNYDVNSLRNKLIEERTIQEKEKRINKINHAKSLIGKCFVLKYENKLFLKHIVGSNGSNVLCENISFTDTRYKCYYKGISKYHFANDNKEEIDPKELNDYTEISYDVFKDISKQIDSINKFYTNDLVDKVKNNLKPFKPGKYKDLIDEVDINISESNYSIKDILEKVNEENEKIKLHNEKVISKFNSLKDEYVFIEGYEWYFIGKLNSVKYNYMESKIVWCVNWLIYPDKNAIYNEADDAALIRFEYGGSDVTRFYDYNENVSIIKNDTLKKELDTLFNFYDNIMKKF